MSNEVKKQVSEEYELSEVPIDRRKSFAAITVIWAGYVLVVSMMIAGGGMASGLNFVDIIKVTISGNIFLCVVAVFLCVIACKTGLTFALLSRHTFGVQGSRIASLFVPVVNIGWYAIQSCLYGYFLALVFGVEGTIWEYIFMVLSVLIMGLFSYFGVNTLSVLGYVAMPAIVFLCLTAAYKATTIAGGFDKILAYVPPDTMPLSSGITIVIGTWILTCASSLADIMRYAKNVKQAIISTAIGLIGGNCLIILSAAVCAIALQQSDITVMLLGMGLVIPSFILMSTNLFTTNAANLYSISLNLSNAFRMDRKKTIIIVLIISSIVVLFKPHQVGRFFLLLEISGMIIPPLAGILFSDYYIVNKSKYKSLKTAQIPNWKFASWATWIISSVLVYNINFGLPAVNGIVFAFIIYPILNKVMNRKVA